MRNFAKICCTSCFLDFLAFLCYNVYIIVTGKSIMNNKKSSGVSGGTVVAGIVIMFIVFACIGASMNGNSSSKSSSSSYSSSYSSSNTYVKPSSNYATSSYTTPKYEAPKTNPITWHCIDVTSYNQNAYDDNKCTSSAGEVRYVSDSQAIALDPSYSPGKSGAYYYNNK